MTTLLHNNVLPKKHREMLVNGDNAAHSFLQHMVFKHILSRTARPFCAALEQRWCPMVAPVEEALLPKEVGLKLRGTETWSPAWELCSQVSTRLAREPTEPGLAQPEEGSESVQCAEQQIYTNSEPAVGNFEADLAWEVQRDVGLTSSPPKVLHQGGLCQRRPRCASSLASTGRGPSKQIPTMADQRVNTWGTRAPWTGVLLREKPLILQEPGDSELGVKDFCTRCMCMDNHDDPAGCMSVCT
ncbi:unnamed protein product [Boreogadus saida]